MTRNAMNLAKGIGTGIAAGVAVGVLSSQMYRNKNQVKRKAGKAMQAVGDLLDNVQYMFNK